MTLYNKGFRYKKHCKATFRPKGKTPKIREQLKKAFGKRIKKAKNYYSKIGVLDGYTGPF